MCVTCDLCRYDSGDFDSGEEIAKKVNGDGGFMDRDLAEVDVGFKQLIPYAIIKAGDRILIYTRGKKGGEVKLHAKRSGA